MGEDDLDLSSQFFFANKTPKLDARSAPIQAIAGKYAIRISKAISHDIREPHSRTHIAPEVI